MCTVEDKVNIDVFYSCVFFFSYSDSYHVKNYGDLEGCYPVLIVFRENILKIFARDKGNCP